MSTLLSHYYQPDRPIEVEEAALLDWVDVLSLFRREEIESACGTYLRNQPRRRPSPGDIRAIALTAAKERMEIERAKLPPPQTPPKVVVDAETAERITQGAGFTKERSDLLKKMPMVRNADDLRQEMSKPKESHWTDAASKKDLSDLERARASNPIIAEMRARHGEAS